MRCITQTLICALTIFLIIVSEIYDNSTLQAITSIFLCLMGLLVILGMAVLTTGEIIAGGEKNGYLPYRSTFTKYVQRIMLTCIHISYLIVVIYYQWTITAVILIFAFLAVYISWRQVDKYYENE